MQTLQEIDKDYRIIEAMSSSKLKELLTSPALYYQRYISKELPSKESYAMDFGTKVHAALLQPDLFESSYKTFPSYMTLPRADAATVKGRCRWEEVQDAPLDDYVYYYEPKSDDAKKKMIDAFSNYYGKEIVTPGETKKINTMIEQLSLNPQTLELLNKDRVAEKVLMTVIDDIELKSKLDAIITDNIVFDYKSCEHAINDELITWSIKKYSYDLQAYFYKFMAEKNGYDIKEFVWIFQNKHSGQCAVVPCPDYVLERGAAKMKLGLEIYRRCMSTGVWADYVDPETGATNYDAPMDISRAVEKVYR